MERKVKQTGLRLKTWNGSAMIPGLTCHLQGVHDARKTAVIVKELSRLHVDIIVSLSKRPGSQELALCVKIKRNSPSFGKGSHQMRKESTVLGFSFGNSYLGRIVPPNTDRRNLLVSTPSFSQPHQCLRTHADLLACDQRQVL